MSPTTSQSKLQFWTYRVSTVLRSLKTLYTLPQEKIDAFLNSYTIYDHDWVNEDQMIASMGIDYYQEVKQKLINYYSVLNHLCSVGQVEKMYIPPAMDLSCSIIENQALYERKMSRDLGLAPGHKAVDIGCGRGRVASHVASTTGANVTGINIDLDQLESAQRFASRKGLSKQCKFQVGDFNERLAFADGSLDAAYHIQVLSLAKNLQAVCEEVFRVLKPGGRFACLDWVRLPKYDQNNPYHAKLMKRVKPLIGAIGTPSVEEYVGALERAGFTVLVSENLSVGGLQAPLIQKADQFFTKMTSLIRFLTRYRLIPAHFKALFDRLTKDGDAFIEADRLGLVTTSYYILAEKKGKKS